jgi:hypothetical protein
VSLLGEQLVDGVEDGAHLVDDVVLVALFNDQC